MQFIPNCGCINTTVCMHRLDANKMHEEKDRWEVHKTVTCCFE